MAKVLQDAIQVLLISNPIIIDVEDAGLAPIAENTVQVLLVHHLGQVAVAVTERLGIEDDIQGVVQLEQVGCLQRSERGGVGAKQVVYGEVESDRVEERPLEIVEFERVLA